MDTILKNNKINEIIGKVDFIFSDKKNIMKIKNHVASHIAVPEDKVCKREIGIIDDMRICLVNGCEVGVKFYMDFVEGGNDAVYGTNSEIADAHFIPNGEIWLDANINAAMLRFICVHEIYERMLMKYHGIRYDVAHRLANELEKRLKRQFLDDQLSNH